VSKKMTLWVYGHPVEAVVEGADPNKPLPPGNYRVVVNDMSQFQEAIVSEIMREHVVIDSE